MAEDPETDYERAIESYGMECAIYACWNPAGWVEPHRTNGMRETAARLVLMSGRNRDLGGWCQGAVVDRTLALVATREAKVREKLQK